MRVYDVASIANKDVSERIITAPVSPLGQDTHIASKDATCVALPTNQPINPLRNAGKDETLLPDVDFAKVMREDNEEQPMHPIYNYAFITDAEEGLILTNVDTLQDGEPRNNFLTRALTWNEGDILKGARHLTIAGTHFYVSADAGVVELDMDDPLHPKVMAVIPIAGARGDGGAVPLSLRRRRGRARCRRRHRSAAAASWSRARTCRSPMPTACSWRAPTPMSPTASDGLAIIDVERPDHPQLYMQYTAGGKLDDARDVVVGATNASLFAYVADGATG